MGQKVTRDVGDEPEKRKLDLSAAQVAGSSLATVAAALLASKMGVYGTILGAGVVSVVATAGGPVIQHLFRRTGDQLRESARPRARQVPPPRQESAGADPVATEEFGEATVHGTRVRGWKRTAVASGAAFAIAVGGLGTYEAMAGTSVSSGGGTLFSGGTRKAGQDRPAPPADEPGGAEKGGRSPGSGTSPAPSEPAGGRSPSPGAGPSGPGTPGPSGTPGNSADPAPGATPSKEAPSSSPAPTPAAPTASTSPAPGPDASAPAARRSPS
ncbi:hypothetical protein DEJ51_25400 [Streptomyces venezuelae]|uniref:Uncharacterized protein n=2 Tax=Streptomyces venezuelae TaxID=54571 RepID=A0A5P2DVI8_STRVZ|nr:hypothetical protein [Streptomyces venezuelae]QES59184.1 hypothetical protein DEJ51_25400 [Streptomyces venezuelae]